MELLSSQVRSFMSRSLAPDYPAGEEEFNDLALALFAFQREAVPIYRELCERRRAGPDSVRHWRQIPPLPARAFKEYEVSSIPAAERTRVFHSSGTAGQAPSRHFHGAESLVAYEDSLLPWFQRHFFTTQSPPMKFVFLTPETAPHSSLAHMFATVRRHFGAPDSVFTGRAEAGGSWSLDLERTLAALREAAGENRPVGVLGTAFSFVHLLDHLQAAAQRLALPKGSRVMETGGYKGRTRAVPKAQFRQMLAKFLGVPSGQALAEYGMSELSSQAYESAGGVFHFPPWARARVISPETGAEAGEGETGLLRVFDLANIGSVMAVQTEDLAARRGGGFELLGRAASAEPRGCSLLPGLETATMELPSYFLADLPSEAELTAGLITEACQTLKRNRQQFLDGRATEEIIRVLDRLGEDWQSDDFSFRQMVLQAGPAATGFSAEVLAAGLGQFFKELTAENLESLLRQELGRVKRLDDFFPNEDEGPSMRAAMALGPRLLAHIAPGNIPAPVLMEMTLGLLTRSALFVKCASGQSFIPRMFAHSLYEADRKLGACLEIAAWKGGSESLDSALFAEADCIVATGSDETLAAIREKLPASARFIGHGSKVSFGYVTREALERQRHAVVERAAADVTAWNQRGCLSPHVIYVEDNGGGTGEDFANLLAAKLEALEKTHPRGALSAGEAAAIATRRAFYEVRAAHSPETMMWASRESTAWTVVLESDPRFQISCQNRFIYVKVVADLTQALQGAELVREKISTVGVACVTAQTAEWARRLGGWGAKRICPLGQMQHPPLGWRHDGRPPLGDLVTWVDWEKH